jgi:hypothetical protein
MQSVSKPGRNSSCRPRLEWLEERLQPSGLPYAAAAFSPTPLVQVGAVSRQAEPHADGVPPPGVIDYGTFVTGTTGAATGRGVAVDAADDRFVTGGLDDGTARSAYVRKYLPDGTPDPAFPFVTLRVTIDGVAYDTEGRGIAVDPTTGDVDVVGAAADPATGNQAAFFARYDPTGTLLSVAAYGNDSNPNSFDGIAVDTVGDAVFTGTLSVPASGHSDLAFGELTGGGPLMVTTYELPMTDGGAGLGITVDSGASYAYLAGFAAAATPGGPRQGLFAQVNINDLGFGINYRLAGSPAGAVVVNAVAVNASGAYFAVTTPAAAEVVRLDPALTTFLNEYDFKDPAGTVAALELDSAGNVYVTGQSLNTASGNLTAQLTQLDSSLHLVNTVQVGGSGTDAGLALAVKSIGSVVVAGTTGSGDFPVTGGTALNGTTDAFLVSYTFPS